MFSVSLTTPLDQLVLVLNQHYDDVAWLDSPKPQDLSILAFGSHATQHFLASTPLNEFRDFFENFSVTSFKKSAKPTSKNALGLSPLWIGYFSYEAFRFNPLIPFQPQSVKPYPLSVWRHYQSYLVSQNGNISFVSFAENAASLYEKLLGHIADGAKTNQTHRANEKFVLPACQTDWPTYQRAFAKIQHSLRHGDYFELNHTIEFSSPELLAAQDLAQLYLHLRQTAKAPMMAFLPWRELKILSASPELFFNIVAGGTIITHPIKGTIARGLTHSEDEMQKTKLLQSTKDQAELLMVTDLLRNDLGRICEVGTVQTPQHLSLQTFSHYHHLFSEITGQLRRGLTFFDVFCALFPGGSITGAPKIQVMRAIQNLENRPRGLYTGAVGVISECGWSQFSIAIRTLTQTQDRLEFATGGGIVVDSSAEAEYEECFVKARGLMEALKKFLALAVCVFFLFGCAKDPVSDSGDFDTVSDENTILIRDYTFFPEEILAAAGEVLTIYNYDVVPHELLSGSAPNAFDDTGDITSAVILPNEFGFVSVPESALEDDVYFLYCNQLQDLMATPNAKITVVAPE